MLHVNLEVIGLTVCRFLSEADGIKFWQLGPDTEQGPLRGLHRRPSRCQSDLHRVPKAILFLVLVRSGWRNYGALAHGPIVPSSSSSCIEPLGRTPPNQCYLGLYLPLLMSVLTWSCAAEALMTTQEEADMSSKVGIPKSEGGGI